jgi:protein TonB
MKNLVYSFLIGAILLSCSAAQDMAPMPRRVRIDSKLAETLLIHKEQPACQRGADGVHVTGTVVIAITYDRAGRVIHAHVISGPAMLRPLALATVRRYRYKPYLLNNTPVEVVTEVSISIDCFFHTGQA